MSLKDLLGMFEPKQKRMVPDNLNASLAQGANYNQMQSRIDASVEPQLSLIEQTTSPSLGSIVENFSGNTMEAPLNKVNTKEFKELQDLEDQLNKQLTAYTAKQNSILTGIPQAKRGKGWEWNDIKDNIMWQGEKSPADCEAACNADSNCTGWETCTNGKKCRFGQGCSMFNKPNLSPPVELDVPKELVAGYQSALANRELQGTVKAQMNTMFNNLQAKAKELQQKTMAFHARHQELTGENGTLTNQKASTLKQLKNLQSQNVKLDKLMRQGSTLSAEIQDNRLQMDAAYMRYFVWLGAAVTLGLVAMHRAAK